MLAGEDGVYPITAARHVKIILMILLYSPNSNSNYLTILEMEAPHPN